jgi:hypothetical protein
MDFREIEWSGRDCMDLSRERDLSRALVNIVMNLPVP